MDVTHLFSNIRVGGFNVLAQVKGDTLLVSVGFVQCEILLWSLSGESSKEPLAVLEGHKTSISLLAVSDNSHWLLSVSADCMLLWELEVCLPPTQSVTTKQITCCDNDITYACFSSPSDYLAVCSGNSCYIIDIETCSLVNELQGHLANITCLCFIPSDPTSLVTVSDDRTFKIWNIIENKVLTDVNTISQFNNIVIYDQYIAVSSPDSKLYVYGLHYNGQCPLIRHMDIECLLRKYGDDRASSFNDPLIDKRVSCLALTFLSVTTPIMEIASSYYRDLISNILYLLILTNKGVLLINALTGEVVSYYDTGTTHHLLLSTGNFKVISTNEILCYIQPLLGSTVTILKLSIHHQLSSTSLSVLSSELLVKNSPLKAELIPRNDSTKPVSKTRGGGIHDQPVTFKSKVKSSGYSQSPRMTLFKPQVKSVPKQPTGSKPHPPIIKETSSLLTTGDIISTVTINSRPVQSSFNNNGSQFTCIGGSPFIYLLKTTNLTSPQQSLLQGHDGCVRGVAWSHSNSLLLSCSADRTAHLWSPSNGRPLMTLTHLQHNFKQDKTGNPPFPNELQHISFYYLDKFILLSCTNTLYMYKYHIDTSTTDDIKRYQNKSHYKLVTSLVDDSTHSITALSCINEFHSYLVLTAGSNRSLNVYDMNTTQRVWSQGDAHSKPVHWITQNKGSKFTECVSETYDIFMTSSVNDGIKLWDIRTQKCVRWYTSFQNRSQQVTTSFSPCGRYIATGSEERAVIVYDLRHLSPLYKLPCPSPVISTVNYHPKLPGLTGCSLDGQIYFNMKETLS